MLISGTKNKIASVFIISMTIGMILNFGNFLTSCSAFSSTSSATHRDGISLSLENEESILINPHQKSPLKSSFNFKIPSWIIADGMGNRDGMLSGYEILLKKALDKLPVGKTCILGMEYPAITSMKNLARTIHDVLCIEIPEDFSFIFGMMGKFGFGSRYGSCPYAVKIMKLDEATFGMYGHLEQMVTDNFGGFIEIRTMALPEDAQFEEDYPSMIQYPEIKKIVLDRMQSFSIQCQERIQYRIKELDRAIEARLCPVEELYHIAHEIGLDESHCRNGEGCNRLSGEPWRPLVCEEGTELYYQMTLELAAVLFSNNPANKDEAKKCRTFFLYGEPENLSYDMDILFYYSNYLKEDYTKETLENFPYDAYFDNVRAMEIVENSGLMSPEEAMVSYIPLGVYDDVYDRMYYKYMNGETDSLWTGAVVSMIRRCKWDELSKLELTKYLAPERIEWYKRVCDYQKTGL